MSAKKPLYYSDNVHVGNSDSEIGIVCLWTKKERIIEKINDNNYCFIGQLYSREYGLQILLRNLLANPHIRNIVVTGVDLNDCSEGLINFFIKGVDNKNRIKETDILLDEEIKKKHVDLLRRRVKVHDLRKLSDFSKLDEYLKKIKPLGEPQGISGERIILPLPKISPPRRFPTDFSGFKARGQTFYEAYKNLITLLLRFGVYDHQKKMLILPSVTFFVKKFSEQDKKYLVTRKNIKFNLQKISFEEERHNITTYMFPDIDCWDVLRDLMNKLSNQENICVMIAKAFIKEKDLEDAVEMLDSPHTLRWDSDPHGDLVIRVENGMIKINHFSRNGAMIDEFSASNLKELFKKISSEQRVSLLSHALDIGAELQKAEFALKQGKKYVQDKKE